MRYLFPPPPPPQKIHARIRGRGHTHTYPQKPHTKRYCKYYSKNDVASPLPPVLRRLFFFLFGIYTRSTSEEQAQYVDFAVIHETKIQVYRMQGKS